MPQIEVFPDVDAVAIHASSEFSRLAANAIAARGRFSVALSGGSTPKRMFQQLVGAVVDWRNIHLFWVDERCVPPDHPDSNYGMTAAVLLDHIKIPKEHLHRIHGELEPGIAARIYEKDIQEFFCGEKPIFDLILLGVGTDGHTASLFPGSPALKEQHRWVIDVEHNTPPPPLVNRVTLTFPVLNAGENIIFLVSGRDKAKIVACAFGEPKNPLQIPVQEIISTARNIRWLLDKDSAGDLST